MISIIVTAWEEPREVRECLKRIFNQKNLKEKFEVLATAPDEPTKKEILKYVKKYPKKIKFTKQPREKGKNEMLNLLMRRAKGGVLLFTDGDVLFNDIAISEILKLYQSKNIGAVTGRIIPQNSRKRMMGYWAHLLTNVIHKIREDRYKNKKFIECSGYLYSIRKGIIKKIPLDVAEDSIMPLFIWQKGYKIGYAPKAIGYVRYPETFDKWLSQKVRCAKSHELLGKYGSEKIKMKTFKNEVIYGFYWSLTFPKNIKEVTWTILLFLARFYVWILLFAETKIKNQHYGDKWEKIKTT